MKELDPAFYRWMEERRRFRLFATWTMGIAVLLCLVLFAIVAWRLLYP